MLMIQVKTLHLDYVIYSIWSVLTPKILMVGPDLMYIGKCKVIYFGSCLDDMTRLELKRSEHTNA